MDAFLILALLAFPAERTPKPVAANYPCHFKQEHCPPPPPITIPDEAHKVCASQKEGTEFIWMLNPNRAIEGHCQTIEGRMRFVVANKNK